MPRSPHEEARDQRGPELVSFADMSRKLADAGVKLSPQRIRQLAESDPTWPLPMDQAPKTGRIRLFDWRVMEPYFATREKRQGERTDLPKKADPPAE
ncbi:hypothetical protein [Streptacidiphilus sp. EB129]|uniref:hypothetical protein n=1 Tax=Streptacidiphilus sp. EB129 TaxID=3156262 RepID=UPI0035115880